MSNFDWPFSKLFTTSKRLTRCVADRPRELQDLILVAPMAVSKMMDLLNDPREVIRNDVSSAGRRRNLTAVC